MRPRLIADDAVLDAALSAFANLGYEGASIRAVAREIGISHNTINDRFGTKDKLWYAAVDHAFAELADVLQGKAIPTEDDTLTALHAATQRFVQYTAAKPALLRVVIHEAPQPGPRFEHMYTTYLKPAQDIATEIITGLQDTQRLRPGPVSPTFFFLVTMGLGSLAGLTHLVSRFSHDGADPADIAQLAVDIVFDGFTA